MSKDWWRKFWKMLWEQGVDLLLAVITFVLMIQGINIFITLWRIK